MKKLIILLLVFCTLLINSNALILENITLSTSDNISLSFNRSVNVSSVELSNDSIILWNFSFLDKENFSLVNGTVTDKTNINWQETDSLVDSSNFLSYFRFNDTSTGSLISNYTIKSISSLDQELRILFSVIGSSGVKDWLFSKSGYTSTIFSFNNSYDSYNNITFNISYSSINVNIYDRETTSYISETVNLTLIATPTGLNGSTSNGTYTFQDFNLGVGSYELVAESENYISESIYFTYNNEESLSVNIYMINKSSANAGIIRILARDEFTALVPGAICYANEWRSNLSSFVNVAQGLTNGNGETFLNIELNSKLYRFECQYEGVSGSIPQEIITTNNETRTIYIIESESQYISIFDSTTTNVYQNITGNYTLITYNWLNSAGVEVTACINYYSTLGISKSLINSTCVSSSSGTLQQLIAINNTFNLLIETTLGVNDETYNIRSFSYPSILGISESLAYYDLDRFIMPVAVILALMLVFLTKFSFLGEFIGIIILWAGVGVVPSLWNGTLASIGTVILLLMIYWGYKSK